MFGDIEFIDLQKDPVTNKCMEYCFIQFKRTKDAKEALKNMDKLEIHGKTIKVGAAGEVKNPQKNEEEEKEQTNPLFNAASKNNLIASINREGMNPNVNRNMGKRREYNI